MINLNPNFNSRMVRLKARGRYASLDDAIRFQFQNGAIKSGCMLLLRTPQKNFNSRMVRLKVLTGFFRTSIAFQFQFQNGAIKRRMPTPLLASIYRFQFQNGAIKSLTSGYMPTWVRNFNSRMVRLKERHTINLVILSLISIPEWCD